MAGLDPAIQCELGKLMALPLDGRLGGRP